MFSVTWPAHHSSLISSGAPFCSLCFSSLSHLHVLDLDTLFHASVFVCFCTQIPSSIMPSSLCLSCGMSHLLRFISSVNSSMNLPSIPPLLGGIDPSAPCVSLGYHPNYAFIMATTMLSHPYLNKYESPVLDFCEFLKHWDCVLLIHFIHSI